MAVIPLKPKYYNCFLVHQHCHNCGEDYLGTDLYIARDIPNGEAFSPVPPNGVLFDIPVHKKEARRDVAFCPMCIDKAEKHELPVPKEQVMKGKSPVAVLKNEDAQTLLKTLGLI